MREHRARQVAEGFLLLEALRWHDGRLSVLDVFDRKTHVLCADGARMRCIATADTRLADPPDPAVLLDGGATRIAADMWAHRLIAFDRAPDGALSRRRVFAELPGREPGGLCADAEGGIWVACFRSGDVLRVVEGGTVTDRIACPRHAIACQLGGDDGRTLFCTAYTGTVDDMDAGRRLAVVYAATVAVPAPEARLAVASAE